MDGSARLQVNRFAFSPAAAVAIGVVIALVALPNVDWTRPAAVAAQLLCSVGATVAVLRPRVGSVLLGTLLLVMVLAFPNLTLGLAVLAYPVAIATCAARGHRLIGLIFALWCLALLVAATSGVAQSAIEMTQAVNIWLVIMFAPLLLGETYWRLQRRSERQRKDQIVGAERQRRSIARDLHDTLAYATTTMVMKAEQARLRGGQDEQTLADLDYIASIGRSATADLRTILAMLREAAEGKTPDEADAALPALLPPTRLEEVLDAQQAKLAAFNFQVNLSINGDPTTLPDHLSAVLARAFTEIASNITKHGDPCCEVSILIDFGSDDIEVVFVNTPRPTPSDSGHRGLGLLGLREVVEAEGGSLESGPVGNRWISHLTLPVEGGNNV